MGSAAGHVAPFRLAKAAALVDSLTLADPLR
jgi:hypothetical protein